MQPDAETLRDEWDEILKHAERRRVAGTVARSERQTAWYGVRAAAGRGIIRVGTRVLGATGARAGHGPCGSRSAG